MTKGDVVYAVERARERIDHYAAYALACLRDEKRKERREAALCPLCFYEQGRIGGCAMTTTNCSNCVKELNFSSTCTDKLCKECANNLKLCMHCGATQNLKIPRGLVFE